MGYKNYLNSNYFVFGQMKMMEFCDFQVDLQGEQLWRRGRAIKLRPKTWQVLCHFLEHAGQLVSTSQLLDTVWSEVGVSHGTLTQSIAELRRALGDDASRPAIIQTVHRRGYRFIADLRTSPSPRAPQRLDERNLPPAPAFGAPEQQDGHIIVGREAELERLEMLLKDARAGRRQIVFVTGGAGIGKTSLLRTFLQGLNNANTGEPVWIAGGKCVEFVGEGESYLPALEALEHLGRIVEPELLRRIVTSRAPTWRSQIPWLTEPDEERETPSPVQLTTPTRMLRESCVAVEALTEERTLVLWFEDLHWADSATVDLIAALAARREPCRLLLLASYRPVEAAMKSHPVAPLKRTLVGQQAGVELPLELLKRTAVQSYLERRFPPGLEPSLADVIYHLTEGNPLFMVTLMNHLGDRELLAQTDEKSPWTLTVPLEELRDSPPESVAELIELQLSRTDAETLSALEAASVEGVTFSSQAVAAATGKGIEAVEASLEVLAGRGQLVEARGAERWPDGSVGETFRFLHSVFCTILYRRQTESRRQRAHLRIAERLEQGFEDQPDLPAAALALHFEKGGDPERAVHYLVEAAAGVRQRAGDRQAVAYFERALELLSRLPDDDERTRQELDLRMHLWKEINASGVFSSAEQNASLERALELCDRLGDEHCQAYVSSCHTRSLIIQSKLDAASAVDLRRTETAKRLADPILLGAAHSEAGDIAYYRGELDRSLEEQARCLSALEGVDPHATRDVLGHDPAVLAMGYQGWVAWLQGRPDEARRHAGACLDRAEAGGYPLNQAFALALALQVEQFRRDADAAGGLAAELMKVAEEYGFDLPYPTICAILGWTASRTGEPDAAIASLREGVALCRRTQTFQALSHHLATLAELELEAGAAREGLAAIDEALSFVKSTGECFWEAELHRLNGALLLLDGEREGGEACFRKALDVARSQGARSLELRAATALSRLWRDQSREDEARSLLASIYDGFTEGFDTQDLRDAKALLDSL